MKKQPEKFEGVGTVFMSDVFNFTKLTEHLTPEELVEILNQYLFHVTTIIEKHAGIVLQYEGDTVLALWHPEHNNPNHAQLAFDASREILITLPDLVASQKHLPYNVGIVLGTGDMIGDFFSPANRYQVIGKAMAIVSRINKIPKPRGSAIRMSQYTLNLINPEEGTEETETIRRDKLEDLKVFTYFPVNNPPEHIGISDFRSQTAD